MVPKYSIPFEEAAPLRAKPYIHTANYYETDQMKIIHHSNYIRWMEEARVDVTEQLGFGYARLESMGIFIPVLGVSVDYKSMVRFGDRVSIECRIGKYSAVKLTMLYRMTNLTTGDICAVGESRHGFLDGEGRAISLKRAYPEIHQLILDGMETADQ